MILAGQRIIIRSQGSEIDGWGGYAESVTPQDVMVRLDRATRATGRLVSLPPHVVFPDEDP